MYISTGLVAAVLDSISQYHFPPLLSISLYKLLGFISCCWLALCYLVILEHSTVMTCTCLYLFPYQSFPSLSSCTLVPFCQHALVCTHIYDLHLASRLPSSTSTSNLIPPPLLDYDSCGDTIQWWHNGSSVPQHAVFHNALLKLYNKMAAHRPNYSHPPPEIIGDKEEHCHCH